MVETRKLYRSRINRQVAGVCGGLAQYFYLEATLIRILFVVLAVLGVPASWSTCIVDHRPQRAVRRGVRGGRPDRGDADAAVIDAIRQDPAGYYVNVPTPATGGAIRGRLQASPQRKHQRGDRTVSDQERDRCNAGVPWSV